MDHEQKQVVNVYLLKYSPFMYYNYLKEDKKHPWIRSKKGKDRRRERERKREKKRVCERERK